MRPRGLDSARFPGRSRPRPARDPLLFASAAQTPASVRRPGTADLLLHSRSAVPCRSRRPAIEFWRSFSPSQEKTAEAHAGLRVAIPGTARHMQPRRRSEPQDPGAIPEWECFGEPLGSMRGTSRSKLCGLPPARPGDRAGVKALRSAASGSSRLEHPTTWQSRWAPCPPRSGDRRPVDTDRAARQSTGPALDAFPGAPPFPVAMERWLVPRPWLPPGVAAAVRLGPGYATF